MDDGNEMSWKQIAALCLVWLAGASTGFALGLCASLGTTRAVMQLLWAAP